MSLCPKNDGSVVATPCFRANSIYGNGMMEAHVTVDLKDKTTTEANTSAQHLQGKAAMQGALVDCVSKAAVYEKNTFRVIWQSTQQYAEVAYDVRMIAANDTAKDKSPLLITIQPTVLVVENPPPYINRIEETIATRQHRTQRWKKIWSLEDMLQRSH